MLDFVTAAREISMNCSSNLRLGATHSSGFGKIVQLQRRLPPPGFTARDRGDLARWAAAGRRAVCFEDEDGTTFAMLYDGSAAWALWAMARQDGGLLVWNCITFADVGRFGCMLDALAALSDTPGASLSDAPMMETRSNVIAFATAHLNQRLAIRASVASRRGFEPLLPP